MPDSVATFQGRCNYLADHFWDFCEMTKAFSARQKMAQEMKVYLSVVANAEPSVAVRGVNALMKKLEKQPKDQVFMATVAESQLYGDTAEMWIDGLYLPFAEAVAANKRVSKARRHVLCSRPRCSATPWLAAAHLRCPTQPVRPGWRPAERFGRGCDSVFQRPRLQQLQHGPHTS